MNLAISILFSTFATEKRNNKNINYNITYMKKFLFIIIFAFVSMTYLTSCKTKINKERKFITLDSMALYTFTNDSLYIDAAISGCPIISCKLKPINRYKFYSVSTIHDLYEGNSISVDTITIRHIHYTSYDKNSMYELSFGNKFKDTIMVYK